MQDIKTSQVEPHDALRVMVVVLLLFYTQLLHHKTELINESLNSRVWPFIIALVAMPSSNPSKVKVWLQDILQVSVQFKLCATIAVL